MALIVSLETSGTACSVALHDGGRLVGTRKVTEQQAHAAKLAILIQDLLRGDGRNIQPDAVAVSSGPGSYTGLRIGTSTAKGICSALHIPLIAVNTLDLLSIQFLQQNKGLIGLLCPMIDAKRMEVYCHIVDQDMQAIQGAQAVIIEPSSFGELLKDHKMFFFGEGAAKCKGVISHENAFFRDGYSPDASALGEIAFTKFQKSEFEDLINFVPFYLKDFVAKKAAPVF